MKKLDFKELFGWATPVLATAMIFLITLVYLNAERNAIGIELQNVPEIFLALLLAIITASGLFLFVKKHYSRKKFLTFYEMGIPIASFTVLTVFFIINHYLKNVFVNLLTIGGIFSFAFLVSSVALIALHYLRSKEHKFQTVSVYRMSWKFFEVYALLLIVSMVLYLIVFNFPSDFPPWISGYYEIIFLQSSLLAFATAGFFLAYRRDKLRYCKIGIETIKDGLDSSKKGINQKTIFIKKFLPIFPTIISRFNEVLEVYPESPYIPNSQSYRKTLYISALSGDEHFLWNANKGLEQMGDAVDPKPKKDSSYRFDHFVKGLTLIKVAERKGAPDVTEVFEFPPSLPEWFKRNATFISIVLAFLSIFLTIIVFKLTIGNLP